MWSWRIFARVVRSRSGAAARRKQGFQNKEVIQMQSQATYNHKVVRQFAIMTVVGIVGMLVGVIAAAQRPVVRRA